MEFIRERALKGDFLAGAWLNLASPLTAEMAGLVGYDWLLIDQEHAPGDNWTILHQLQAASRFPVASIVRVPWVDRILFKKILDLGAAGIMTPYVQTAEEAKEVVKFGKYMPMGERGIASSPRCADYSTNFANYFENANKNTILVAQIETGKSVDNAEAIAAVDGIDVLFVGPMDLSISTNLRKMFEDDKYVANLKRVATAAKNNGKACGILLPHAKWIPLLKGLGFTFIACGADGGYVLNGMKTTLEALRA
ncbi:HpcH/HpaI aldolase/citrate lyase family protein [uncultured delta proteobacterium]|uniref:HpcH/HpaI aldolase/citrate lyase family protein n=1 Tax=uncultured delta proteobacterium TaxID=34034 RepID=A0A212J8V2_9DELT|nr:HpcH/HpaI aldolase/citrate lyase family protein [uncultured delta proteobacterium]